MTSNDFKDLAMIAMVCVTAGFCVTHITKCDHRNIDITCDVKEPACIKFLYDVSERK